MLPNLQNDSQLSQVPLWHNDFMFTNDDNSVNNRISNCVLCLLCHPCNRTQRRLHTRTGVHVHTCTARSSKCMTFFGSRHRLACSAFSIDFSSCSNPFGQSPGTIFDVMRCVEHRSASAFDDAFSLSQWHGGCHGERWPFNQFECLLVLLKLSWRVLVRTHTVWFCLSSPTK